MAQPRIALVQDWLTTFAGGEQTLLAMHELYPEAPIFTSLYNPTGTSQFAEATVIPSFLQRIPRLYRHHQLAIPLMPLAFESLDLRGYDLIVSVGGGLSKGVITDPGQRHLAYLHTPIRYIWRLGGDDRNEGRFDSWLRALAAHYLRTWDVVSASRPDEYIANSRTVQARIRKIYHQESTVIYPPVDTEKYRLGNEKREDFFLTVSRLVPYKKIDLIIQACQAAGKPLKVVGSGPEFESYRKLAMKKGVIEILGRVSDTELGRLYSTAQAFIMAAEEDFGIVPVEAMSAGCPVLAYGKGGLTETVIPGMSGVLFTEQTVPCLAAALIDFPQKWDALTIRNHAKTFDRNIFKEKIRKQIGISSLV